VECGYYGCCCGIQKNECFQKAIFFKNAIIVSTSLLNYSNTEIASISAKLISPAGKVVAENVENLNLKMTDLSKLVLKIID
jgi:hypothetical protein